jgi:hypothetical protein
MEVTGKGEKTHGSSGHNNLMFPFSRHHSVRALLRYADEPNPPTRIIRWTTRISIAAKVLGKSLER